MSFDARLTPARPDLAAAHLKGLVAADRYAEGHPMTVTAPVLDMTARPGADAPLSNQLLFGEGITVYEIDTRSGLAWGQADHDGYVGYVSAAGLRNGAPRATGVIRCFGSQAYAEPKLKSRPIGALPFLARVEVEAETDTHLRIADSGYVPRQHVAPGDRIADDFVAVAERFLGVPYVWGGRSQAGLDCSALVQLALAATGVRAPRDSDMQAAMGVPADGPARRGDLVFWKGHAGIMLDETRLLHSTAHYMCTVIEVLSEMEARVIAAGEGPVTARRRLVGGGG